MNKGKIIIFSAPSGSGKTTIINYLFSKNLPLRFSISATTRNPRENEKNGVEYYFLTKEEFKNKINLNNFLEYEEVYKDIFYGTPKDEVEKLISNGINVVFDVDCIGGINIKKIYKKNALSIFIMPPSIEHLRDRLEGRGTDSNNTIDTRLKKAEYEMSFSNQFDKIVYNDNLDVAKDEVYNIVNNFINSSTY